MFSVLISLLLLLLTAWAAGRVFNRRMEECVPIVFMGTIVFLYIFYCLNLLSPGRYVLYGCMLVLVILAFVYKKPVRQTEDRFSLRLFRQVITPGIVVFLCLSVLLLIFSVSLKPSVWDELRLWAAMPKALHESGGLQVGENSLLYFTMQSYPPGIALFIYFLSAFSGEFWYGGCFAAYWIFSAALLLPVLGRFRWKQWYVMPLVFFVFLLVPVVLTLNGDDASGDWYYAYVTLFIEPVLGCLLGAAFYQAAKGPFRSAFSLTGFALTLFVLPTLKNMGAIYACIVFAAAVVIWFLQKKKTSAGGFKLQGKELAYLVIPILSAAASYFSWQLIIRTRGTGEFIDLNLSSFTGEKFINVLKGMTSWGTIPFVYYILVLFIFGLLLTFVLKDQEWRISLVCFLGFLAAFLIFFYGYVSHYGTMLSSIHRYTSVFTFACYYYLLMRALSAIDLKRSIAVGIAIPVSVILMLAAGYFLFQEQNRQLGNDSWKEANLLVADAEKELKDAESPGRTYLALGGDIRKQSQRHETYAIAAIGSPVNIRNIWCDKLYNEAESGVITDREEMTRIWADHLFQQEYEYVILADPDEDILYAVQAILKAQDSPEYSDIMSDISSGSREFTFLKVIPDNNPYGISFALVVS